MKTFFKKLYDSFKVWSRENVLMFIALIGLIIFLSAFGISLLNKWEMFPLAYLMKIPFAFTSGALGTWGAIAFIKYGIPDAYDKINIKTEGGINSCTEWQQVIYNLCLMFLFGFIFAIALFAL